MEIRPWKNVWRKWRSPEFSGCCWWCGGSQFGTSPWRKGGTLSFLLSSNKFHPNVQTCFFWFSKVTFPPTVMEVENGSSHSHQFPVSFSTCTIQGCLLFGWIFYSDLIYAITWAFVTLSETSKGRKNFKFVKCYNALWHHSQSFWLHSGYTFLPTSKWQR